MLLKTIVAIVGMTAVGLIVWRLLEMQGYATPPTDDEDDDTFAPGVAEPARLPTTLPFPPSASLLRRLELGGRRLFDTDCTPIDADGDPRWLPSSWCGSSCDGRCRSGVCRSRRSR